MKVAIITRDLENDMPAYVLRAYDLVWTAYNRIGQPIQGGRLKLADILPGERREIVLNWPTFPELQSARVQIYRPTGYLAAESDITFSE